MAACWALSSFCRAVLRLTKRKVDYESGNGIRRLLHRDGLFLFLWLPLYSFFIQGDGDVIFMTFNVPNFFAGHIPRVEVKLAFLHFTRSRLLRVLVIAHFQLLKS